MSFLIHDFENGIPVMCLSVKGASQGRVLVEQSQSAALRRVFVHVTQETPQKSGLCFRCIFGNVFSINVIWTHTIKRGQSKQVHFRELKPHLIGQTPGLEMYFFFLF